MIGNSLTSAHSIQPRFSWSFVTVYCIHPAFQHNGTSLWKTRKIVRRNRRKKKQQASNKVYEIPALTLASSSQICQQLLVLQLKTLLLHPIQNKFCATIAWCLKTLRLHACFVTNVKCDNVTPTGQCVPSRPEDWQ